MQTQSLLLLCLAGLAAGSAAAQEPELLELARVNETTDIKAQPLDESVTVATAEPGDRFLIVAAEGDWLQIQLFQDNYFLRKSVTTEMNESLRIPKAEAERRTIFRAIYTAEDKALEEAEHQAMIEEQSAAAEPMKNFLIERAKLQVARYYSLSVPALTAIAFEGGDKGWPVK